MCFSAFGHDMRRLLHRASSHVKMDASVRHKAGPPSGGVIDGLGLFDCLSLHFEIQRGIAVSRGDTGVAKPLTDRDDVDARAQQMYCGTVAHAVGVQALGLDRGKVPARRSA